MTAFQLVALLISLTALFSYVNHRFLRLPTTIGVMLIALLLSLSLLCAGTFAPWVQELSVQLLNQIDFDDALMQGMLCFLLFAGALHIDLKDLDRHKGIVAALALAGVAISMLLVAAMIYYPLQWLGTGLSIEWCLLFGAVISPTDPVSVIGILKASKVPKSLEIQIAGESLFNDGIGVVAFLLTREIAVSGEKATLWHTGQFFLIEAVGGGLFGLGTGWIGYRLLKSVDNYRVEIMLTLAFVTGGYALASALHLSGPIAIVVAGLAIGNQGRRYAMSDTSREHLDAFWDLIDQILNAALFVLIGLQLLVLKFSRNHFFTGIFAIPVLLIARYVSVAIPVAVFHRWREFPKGAVSIMTWGGLRGGISVALALSLPAGREREIVLAMTYTVVIFSILVQGLSLRRLAIRVLSHSRSSEFVNKA